MIKEEEITINGHSSNYIYYRELGYDVLIRKPCLIKTKDLMRGSSIKITTICSVCGNESRNTFKDYYNFTNGLLDDFYCVKCKIVKSEKTCLLKYGVKNPMQNDLVKKLLKNKILDKYGVDHYSKTDDFKVKFKKTSNQKYKCDNPFSNNDVKEEIRKTNNKNFGVDYPMQSDTIRKKSKTTCIEKYGQETYSKTDECKKKIVSSSLENYGVDNPMKSKIIKKKIVDNCIKEHGVTHLSKTDDFKIKIKNHRERLTYEKFKYLLRYDYDVLSYSNENFSIIHKDCGTTFSIYKGLIIARNRLGVTICTSCNKVGLQYSSIESELIRFLDDNNISYIKNDRSILSGQELDVYLPDQKIAIEVNGLYWHSELYKDKKYHLNKTIKCNKLDINLIHIWEDDWKNKKDIIKSIILNKVGYIRKKIFARKCIVRSVNSKDSRKFLDDNHIQGFSSSSTKLGLYYDDKLVSLMTFGYRYTNGKLEYELIRFCNIINTIVIGSASKLFNYMLNSLDVSEVISYADISIFSGSIYDILGFKKHSLSSPNYFWIVDGVKKHRFNFSKKKLVSKGFDKNKTEVEIMHDQGYYRVFSCGQEKWIYKK
jgi:G:T-mismatch repair DNA endonuclease (very short patch repair protein)